MDKLKKYMYKDIYEVELLERETIDKVKILKNESNNIKYVFEDEKIITYDLIINCIENITFRDKKEALRAYNIIYNRYLETIKKMEV